MFDNFAWSKIWIYYDEIYKNFIFNLSRFLFILLSLFLSIRQFLPESLKINITNYSSSIINTIYLLIGQFLLGIAFLIFALILYFLGIIVINNYFFSHISFRVIICDYMPLFSLLFIKSANLYLLIGSFLYFYNLSNKRKIIIMMYLLLTILYFLFFRHQNLTYQILFLAFILISGLNFFLNINLKKAFNFAIVCIVLTLIIHHSYKYYSATNPDKLFKTNLEFYYSVESNSFFYRIKNIIDNQTLLLDENNNKISTNEFFSKTIYSNLQHIFFAKKIDIDFNLIDSIIASGTYLKGINQKELKKNNFAYPLILSKMPQSLNDTSKFLVLLDEIKIISDNFSSYNSTLETKLLNALFTCKVSLPIKNCFGNNKISDNKIIFYVQDANDNLFEISYFGDNFYCFPIKIDKKITLKKIFFDSSLSQKNIKFLSIDDEDNVYVLYHDKLLKICLLANNSKLYDVHIRTDFYTFQFYFFYDNKVYCAAYDKNFNELKSKELVVYGK